MDVHGSLCLFVTPMCTYTRMPVEAMHKHPQSSTDQPAERAHIAAGFNVSLRMYAHDGDYMLVNQWLQFKKAEQNEHDEAAAIDEFMELYSDSPNTFSPDTAGVVGFLATSMKVLHKHRWSEQFSFSRRKASFNKAFSEQSTAPRRNYNVSMRAAAESVQGLTYRQFALAIVNASNKATCPVAVAVKVTHDQSLLFYPRLPVIDSVYHMSVFTFEFLHKFTLRVIHMSILGWTCAWELYPA
eukprot:2770965-Pleurochrysis_carterae.AAC.1